MAATKASPETLGDFLRLGRKAKGYSLTKLAGLLKGHRGSALSKVESGERGLNEKTLLRLCEILELDKRQAILLNVCRRLPKSVRDIVVAEPPRTGPRDISRLHALQRDHYDFEAAVVELGLAISADGNALITRRIAGLRPTPSGKRREFVVHHAGSQSADRRRAPVPERVSMFTHTDKEDGGLQFEPEAGPDSHGRYLVRPATGSEWPKGGALCVVESQVNGAYIPTPGVGDYGRTLNHVSRALLITVAFPIGVSASEWRAYAEDPRQSGVAPSRDLLERNVCEDWALTSEPGRASLAVQLPLAGFRYGIEWTIEQGGV